MTPDALFFAREPDPQLIAEYGELDLFNEGRGFLLPRVKAMFRDDPLRYTDLCGEGSRRVLPLLDWGHCGMPYCVTAAQGNVVVGVAWAGRIRRWEDSAFGCNVSFAVRPGFQGRGLATLLAAIAYGQCCNAHPSMEFANLQTRANNLAARGIAEKLGMPRVQAFDCTTSEPWPQTYITYREPAEAFFHRCQHVIASACQPHAEEPAADSPSF